MAEAIHLALRADDRSYFALLKKEIRQRAQALQFSEQRAGELDIIVAELVSNLVKHASGGQLLVKSLEHEIGIEIIGLDNGRGMSDVARMMADGVSTKNTLGHGLGAIERLADLFQVYSLRDWGTVTLVRVFATRKEPKRLPIDVHSLLLPKPGETVCGDGFFCDSDGCFLRVFLGDGLGHGPEAAAAVQLAGAAFSECNSCEPVEVLRFMHDRSRKTRGLVGTVAVFDIQLMQWKLCGVGNIAARIVTPSAARNYLSYNGIIGHNVPRTLNDQTIPWEKSQMLVLCSDGIRSRWDLVRHPTLLRYDISMLSAVLLKDFARYTDDMSVVTCKLNF
ncbi:MAG: serine/threonine protein kinase [Chitinophagaceae bacterium]|nr:MAG: serine/threonine protein kinase [Chitinophagaceae bacterium]